jgi:hypothetical protein
MRNYTNQQVAKTIATTDLSEHHAHQLIPACEMLNIFVTTISCNATIKNPRWKMECHLGENVFAYVHKPDFYESMKQIVTTLNDR